MTKAIAVAKKVKKRFKVLLTPKPFVSMTRRIERVNTSKRICAMTFDDGPFGLMPSPDSFGGRCLTEVILDTLKSYGAHATFDVVGDTGENYPDKCGEAGTPSWGGTKFDHYPAFGKDINGGAKNRGDLVLRMLAEGHQVTNHGYRHIIFGKKPFVYGNRSFFDSADAVRNDLLRLDRLIFESCGYKMTMARPPHYVDGIKGGYTSYDVYDSMGYQYMAASFDGAGWLPLSTLEEEVKAMTEPMRKALCEDPDAFCGQIIFQKDGCNMQLRTPIANALPIQLELLKSYGYSVVAVDELCRISEFCDISEDDPLYQKLAVLSKIHPVAYCDNRLRLDEKMTALEFAYIFAPFDNALKRRSEKDSAAMEFCISRGLIKKGTKMSAPLALPLTENAVKHFKEAPRSNIRREIFQKLE